LASLSAGRLTPGDPEFTVGEALEVLDQIVARGGPLPAEGPLLNMVFDSLHPAEFVIERGLSRRVRTDPAIAAFLHRNRALFGTTASMQGFIRCKPHGYAGDFETLERIYFQMISAVPAIRSWDEVFHGASAPAAVRNRAMVFAGLSASRRPARLASVACGPALDVAAALPESDVREVILVDNDPNALRRAGVNLPANGPETLLHNGNALRWRPKTSLDLIWCAGLFDYLADKVAVFLLRRLMQALAPGGAVVVGNFAPGHASRSYMEVIGDWLLIHRTDQDLLRLARAAGADMTRTTVIGEPAGVNLFLVVEAP
jgi:hypothetical protein